VDPYLRLAAGVDLVDGGGEHEVGAGLFGELDVFREGAGVAVQVLMRAELQRVDEDGDGDEAAAGPGAGRARA